MPNNRPKAFVIMPIDNKETECLWANVFVPTLKRAGFKAERVDKTDDGTSLHAQILQSITLSPLIIADLTLARPNCYYEVGYAMGLAKQERLILCCREDHNADSPNFNREKHKVHFDVSTYSVIWWKRRALKKFAAALLDKIRLRRKQILTPIPVPEAPRQSRGRR